MKISASQVSHAGERQWSVYQGGKIAQSELAQNSKIVTYSQNELFEKIVQNSAAGGQVVSIVRSVGGGESTMLQGEVKIQLHDYVYYSQHQSRAMSFSGGIETADGRSINFALHLLMDQSLQHDFNQSSNIERRPLTEPIVMYFSNDKVKLSNAIFEFYFDIEADDGSIKHMASGSGLLALDRNGDGVINDGRELFGFATSEEFGELAYLDSDQHARLFEQIDLASQGLRDLGEHISARYDHKDDSFLK